MYDKYLKLKNYNKNNLCVSLKTRFFILILVKIIAEIILKKRIEK